MPRMSRRDRKSRAAFKRTIHQLYVPDPANIPEPWDDDDDMSLIDGFDLDEEAEHEHA